MKNKMCNQCNDEEPATKILSRGANEDELKHLNGGLEIPLKQWYVCDTHAKEMLDNSPNTYSVRNIEDK